MKKPRKFDGIPTVMLRRAFPWATMSLAKIPIAAPTPPTHGPNSVAKIPGMITTGQNLTTPIGGGAKIPKYVIIPTVAYRAAFIAVIAILRGVRRVFLCVVLLMFIISMEYEDGWLLFR